MLKKKLLMSFVFVGALCTALPAAAKPDDAEQQVDKQMNRIVRALERNKKSADILIQAARNAGADPAAVAELEQMSAAFREAFMATVSPQQIVESILDTPEIPDSAQGLIITGPDGSTWLVMPSDQTPQAGPKPGCPAFGNKPGKPQKFAQPQPGMQVPPPPPGMQPGLPGSQALPGQRQGMVPQNKPPRFTPPQPGMQVPPPPPGAQPGMQISPPPPGQQQGMVPQNRPPRFTPPQPGMQVPPPPPGAQPGMQLPPPGPAPQGPPAVEGELIILEDVPQYMPLWPTKEDLGKDGVLKYLEKRDARIHGN